MKKKITIISGEKTGVCIKVFLHPLHSYSTVHNILLQGHQIKLSLVWIHEHMALNLGKVCKINWSIHVTVCKDNAINIFLYLVIIRRLLMLKRDNTLSIFRKHVTKLQTQQWPLKTFRGIIAFCRTAKSALTSSYFGHYFEQVAQTAATSSMEWFIGLLYVVWAMNVWRDFMRHCFTVRFFFFLILLRH